MALRRAIRPTPHRQHDGDDGLSSPSGMGRHRQGHGGEEHVQNVPVLEHAHPEHHGAHPTHTRESTRETSFIFRWRGVSPGPGGGGGWRSSPSPSRIPVAVTTTLARPPVTTVPPMTMFFRSARGCPGQAVPRPLVDGGGTPRSWPTRRSAAPRPTGSARRRGHSPPPPAGGCPRGPGGCSPAQRSTPSRRTRARGGGQLLQGLQGLPGVVLLGHGDHRVEHHDEQDDGRVQPVLPAPRRRRRGPLPPAAPGSWGPGLGQHLAEEPRGLGLFQLVLPVPGQPPGPSPWERPWSGSVSRVSSTWRGVSL